MKKNITPLFLLAIVTIAITSCVAGAQANEDANFYVNTANYHVSDVEVFHNEMASNVTRSIGDVSFQVFFDTLYPITRAYRVVDEANIANHTMGPNDCAVDVTEDSSTIEDDYLSLGSNTDSIYVTYFPSSHLYNFTLPSTMCSWVRTYNGTPTVINSNSVVSGTFKKNAEGD